MSLNANYFSDKAYKENHELFTIANDVGTFSNQLLKEFDSNEINLFDLAAQKRIFLFFLTRAIKTYSAIQILCQEGYGQDVSNLVRSLLENLISVKYILCDSRSANQKAVRFVEYKWIMLKRQLSQFETDFRNISGKLSNELISKKSVIMEKFKEYKQKYNVSSDKALLTWSGRSVRDMAKLVDKKLLDEYDSTFRLCSRFSHPSIIGDEEYLNYENNILTFSPSPSVIGIISNLKKAIAYLLDFLYIFNKLFSLNCDNRLKGLNLKVTEVFQMRKYNKGLSIGKSIAGLEKKKDEKILIKFNTLSKR